MTADKGTTSEGQAGFRILLVDNDKDVADSLAMLLKMWGYEVVVAYGGMEALQAARRYKPDCILSDIGMPGMDGYRSAKELRKDDAFKRTTLIAITADDACVRAIEPGFDHHLIKPANPKIVEDLLKIAAGMAKKFNKQK